MIKEEDFEQVKKLLDLQATVIFKIVNDIEKLNNGLRTVLDVLADAGMVNVVNGVNRTKLEKVKLN